MKIKDMIFAYEGILKIDEETTLNNPRFRLKNCTCDLETNEALLYLLFSEGDGIFVHGKKYAFQASEDVGVQKQDFITLITTHPVLSLFQLIV